ncbi:NAD(P)H-hydrate dehydratase [Paracoccus sediminis]|uniref:ADP-dependent (S)-NAD(P)H-hydrate dehydratase n=1 Tax=Paracoccus sediminis TaxID=1214787 RepID=A0A238XUJ9_9RHOB|nr:NAD(P)H-hydrate dehydratase [Paracoccus sediminis]TBN47818.1 NAD(P)H-hydrate dehydratase [Paracoccus sediminis]SNR62746.1 yjeF C-terminal region, hydroxyethylthiazole kinase-related [Paracoccus sediminis]
MNHAPIPLDAAWLRAHPLPVHDDVDKNERGRVVLIGGSAQVPGGVRLTTEAAFQSGAGKVQLAVPDILAIPLGVLLPEAGMFALPTDETGEIAGTRPVEPLLDHCDCLAIGPAMGSVDAAGRILEAILPRAEACSVILDAAAVAAGHDRLPLLRRMAGRLILTPNAGEMAALTGKDRDAVMKGRARMLVPLAQDLGAVVVLKGPTTMLANPQGDLALYGGGGAGLATGGSGDVLAGIIAGLSARGLGPWEAACWGVWLHGEAGRRLSERHGPVGFLARQLPAETPGLMRGI